MISKHSNTKKQNLSKIKNQNKNTDAKESIITDPFGSWTGVPKEENGETPIQDVDDL